MKLHINWGHASATQLKRVLVDAEGDTQSLIQYVDKVVSQCDTCKAFEKAPHIPISGTPTVSMFNEKAQVHPLFPAATIALHVVNAPWRRRAPRILRQYGAPLRTFGLAFLGHRNAFRWTEGANGRMTDSPIFSRNAELSAFFRALARTIGFRNAVMVSREDFPAAFLRMVDFWDGGFLRRRNGARTP